MQVAIDVGGTFTDAIAFDENSGWTVAKVPTTPEELSQGFLSGLERASKGAEVTALLHGTTVVINAILTGRYPEAALVTTEGFRDVLEIMRSDRKDLFDVQQSKPSPLVPRTRRFEIKERIAANGEVVTELDDADIARVVAKVKAAGVEAVAVCLLYSFVNSDHERRLGEALRRELPDVHVSLSHEVLPVYREFERTSTTVVNALAQPLMDSYLAHAIESLEQVGFDGRFLIMQSNGGLAEPVEARARPVSTLFSGPAGGVVCAAGVGSSAGVENVLNLDMGGTSCDVSAVTGGDPDRVTYFEVAGYPVTVSSIDIVTVGAGGGSIASVDAGGGLTVGPDSAGAQPGPACYGRGGTEPTVTDAAVVLGRYDADIALGGEMAINVDLAKQAVAGLAEELGLGLEEAAEGILRLVSVNMANALREVSVERGRDPRSYSLVATGGAGPAHAVEVALELGIPEVLVPPFPGAASAQGMLLADVRREQVKTVYGALRDFSDESLAAAVRAVAEETATKLIESTGEGAEDLAALEVISAIDLRYEGQTYEITIPVSPDDISIERLEEMFHTQHHARYGHSFLEQPLESINLRAAAIQRRDFGADVEPTWSSFEARRQPVYWGTSKGWEETLIISRAEAQSSERLVGPLIIEQSDATIVVPHQVTVEPVAGGSLRLGLDIPETGGVR